MPDYDFSTLSPLDFEILSRDLLQQKWGCSLESFKQGRDRGIDLRYSKPGEKSDLIVQCKHYRGSGVEKLIYNIKNKEMPKVEKLNPARYVLTTSVPLSPKDKQDIHKVLYPYCLSVSDVMGKEDINNLLSLHGQIERNHFKLWLPSTEVLQRLLHTGVFTQSALETEQIKQQISLFVPTSAVDRGMGMLEEHGYCMLTGIPGIGKTTTARILVAHHVESGWEGIYLGTNTEKAFDVFRADAKQVFFYDDFLGLTSLGEQLAKNEDAQLLNLIKACKKHPGAKRLVLTTREYLFEQAKLKHERINRSDIDLAVCTVELQDYTEKIRAQILVNHLFFYGIASEVSSYFVESGAAKETIEHANYNPRIVETICEHQGKYRLNASGFRDHFLEMLDSPEEIWNHAYQNQLRVEARKLLLVFAALGDNASLDALRNEFQIYAKNSGMNMEGFDFMFNSCLDELEGNFISIHTSGKLAFISYHTPSIKDFTDGRLRVEEHFLRLAIKHLTLDEPLLRLAKTLQSIADVAKEDLIEAMFRSDYRTHYSASIDWRGIIPKGPAFRTQTLLGWLDLIFLGNSIFASKEVIDYLEEYFRGTEMFSSPMTAVMRLFEEYEEIHKLDDPAMSRIDLAERIKERCEAPNEIQALANFLEPCCEGEGMRHKLIKEYPIKATEWLEEQLLNANSSEEAYEAIDTVTDVAVVFEQEVDVDAFQDDANQMSVDEESKADMESDDYWAERHEARMEDEAIADILDSVRDI